MHAAITYAKKEHTHKLMGYRDEVDNGPKRGGNTGLQTSPSILQKLKLQLSATQTRASGAYE